MRGAKLSASDSKGVMLISCLDWKENHKLAPSFPLVCSEHNNSHSVHHKERSLLYISEIV